MYKYATAIGVDIGRTEIRTAIVKYDGEIVENMSFSLDGISKRDELISAVVKAIKTTRGKSVKLKVNPLCTGVAARGFIDYQNGIVLGPGHNIADWNNVPLGDILNRETGLPTFIGNDANLMAYAEYSFGVASGYKDIIYVALRSGIGGALIIDGKLFRGMNNAAGEIGQMSIDLNGEESETGIRGSLEHLASSTALVTAYLRLAGKNVRSVERLTARNIFALAASGDESAIKVVNENARIIGVALGNLLSIFSPEIIVLGGGMSMAHDSYLESIKEYAFEYSLRSGPGTVKIERASLGYNASVMGASLNALTRLDGKYI